MWVAPRPLAPHDTTLHRPASSLARDAGVQEQPSVEAFDRRGDEGQHPSAPASPATASVVPRPSAAAGRVLWVDCARGITSILVVYHHVCMGLWTAGLPFWPGPDGALAEAVRGTRMPLFFFLAGLFLERAARRPAPQFLGRKAGGLIYPYVLWSLIQIALLVAFAPVVNTRVDGWRQVGRLLYHPYGPFWFLPVLFGGQVLFLCLYKLTGNTLRVAVAAAGLCIASPWLNRAGLTFTGRMLQTFLVLSMAALAGPRLLHLVGTRRGRLLTAIALGACVVMTVVATTSRSHAWIDPLLITPLGVCTVIALSAVLTRLGFAGPLPFLGTISLEILVTHTIGTGAARAGLVHLFGVREPVAHLVLGTAAGLLVPIACASACRRFGWTFLFRFPASASPAQC